METKKRSFIFSSIVLVTYLVMVAVNGLANALPINGRGTGDISDAYANIFAPAGITFAIWGVIYLLLFGHCIYQIIQRNTIYEDSNYKQIASWFILSSIVNTVWIFAWHYDLIWLSLILMIVILISLIKINLVIRTMTMTRQESLFVKLPFAVYFGWITVATIANVTTFLVAVNWNRFGLSEVFWAVVMILVGAVVGFMAVLYYRSVSYGLVIVWAYFGIYIKHTSAEFFNSQYPSVIVSVLVSIALIIVSEILMVRSTTKKRGVSNG